MAKLQVVGRIQCAPDKTSKPLFITLSNDSNDSSETVRLMTEKPDKQSWCLVSHSSLGSNYLIASYPVPDKILMATTDSMPDYGSAYRIRVVKLDRPIVEGDATLPSGDVEGATGKCSQYLLEKISGSNCYYIRSESGIFSPTSILQGGFGPGSASSDPPKEGDNVTVHRREILPREQFRFQNEPMVNRKK